MTKISSILQNNTKITSIHYHSVNSFCYDRVKTIQNMTMIRIQIDFFYFTLIALNMLLLELTKDYLTEKYSKNFLKSYSLFSLQTKTKSFRLITVNAISTDMLITLSFGRSNKINNSMCQCRFEKSLCQYHLAVYINSRSSN